MISKLPPLSWHKLSETRWFSERYSFFRGAGNTNQVSEGNRRAETRFFDDWHQHRLRIKGARNFSQYGRRMRQPDPHILLRRRTDQGTDAPDGNG
jgi:hypothetical protein